MSARGAGMSCTAGKPISEQPGSNNATAAAIAKDPSVRLGMLSLPFTQVPDVSPKAAPEPAPSLTPLSLK